MPFVAMRNDAAVGPADRGELAELVSLERELAARVARAREEAGELLAAAAEESTAIERAAKVDLAAALAQLGAASARVRVDRITLVEEASRQRGATWNAVSDERLATLAAAVIAELLAELAGPGAAP